MARHLVLVGGGHAHLQALVALGEFTARGHGATLISPSPHHFYSGMGPGLLSRMYRPQQARFHIAKMVRDRGGSFVQDTVVRIDPANRALLLASGTRIQYDVVSFNTGSEVPLAGLVSAPDPRVFPVKPIRNLLDAQALLLRGLTIRVPRVLVIGGGPAGVEVAANLWRLMKDHDAKPDIHVLSAANLLNGFSGKARIRARDSLLRRGIAVMEGRRVQSLHDGAAVLGDGGTLGYDIAFVAVGTKPSALFRDSGVPTAQDGSLLVNNRLQSVAWPEIFGGGDCIAVDGLSLAKVGVYAVRQNPILRHNLRAALEGGVMKPFDPGGNYLLILNMGDGTGILEKSGWLWHGRLAFLLKDYIDRRFMKKYQVSGELDEALDDRP